MRNEKDPKSYSSSSNRRNQSQRQQSQSSHPYTGPPPSAPTQVGTTIRASESVWSRGPPPSKPETPKIEGKQETKSEESANTNIVPRPTYTSTLKSGRPINLVCNHFPFVVVREPIFQFALEFTPEIESYHLKMKLLQTMFKGEIQAFISDGSVLFLKENVGDMDRTVIFATQSYQVSLTFTCEIPVGVTAPLQLYNLLFRKILRDIGLKQIGRDYFDPSRPILISKYNVELWPGFVTSVNANAKGIMLIAEIAHKVLRTDSVLDLLNQYQTDFPKTYKEKLTESVVGQTILTRYNNRTYRIDEIAWEMTPNSTFKKRNGEELSFSQYYMQNHNRSLSTNKQPLLVHKHRSKKIENEETIFLIPELCTMTGISDSMRADSKVMKDVAGYTRVNPEQRGIELNKFIQSVKNSASVSKEMVYWGVDLSSNMLPVTGRVFDPEKICYANNKQNVVDPRSGEWSSLCRNSQILDSTPLVNWLLIYYARDAKVASDFSLTLIKVAQAIGFTIKKPQFVEISQESKSSFAEVIESIANEKTQCVVCLFPKMNKERYDSVKHLCTVKLGIPSQCLILRSLSNEKTIISVCNKIAMQINCKMGGELWKLEIPLKRTMIVGIDVCHVTSRGGESVVGFCATMNDNYTKYCSSVQFQRGGQEIIDGLKLSMGEALRQFFKVNNHLPSLIIVYRDGVGDGMLGAVVKHEVTQMKSAFSMFGENYKPRFAVIVVKKRINTRLFTQMETGLGNPPPGTIVDTDCVHPSWYDFYVVSQSVKQGTASPTHYHVVYDTTELQQEHVQKLTFKLAHLYYNWAGTIRVPAPCQYAHKIAFLVGQHVHLDPHQQLSHVLHYL